MTAGPPLGWTWLGREDYRRTWARQEDARERVLAGDSGAEHLFLVEHQPVITLGRHADERHVLAASDLLARRGIEVTRTNRGGDVTAHGPGQLVIYPVVRLLRGVLAHVEAVGTAIAAELSARGMPARWRRAPAGVWVDDAKIAACGVHVRHGVAIHGFAVNVTDEPLALFELIVPCGLREARATSIAATHAGRPPAMPELAEALAVRTCEALGRQPARALAAPPAA